MLSTSQLVTQLVNDFGEDVTRPQMLSYIDRAHKALWNTDCAQTLFFNRSDNTFPFPVLKTTAGTLSYDITATNLLDSQGNQLSMSITDKNGYARAIECRKIKNVFVMVNSTSISLYNYGERIIVAGINPYWMQNTASMMFYKVPGELYDRTATRNAFFQFNNDPGTQTSLYYLEFYYAAWDLLSESTPLCIDTDMWYEAIKDGVRGILEDVDSGRTEMMDRFLGPWRKKFMRAMNDPIEDRKPLQMQQRKYG